ncbi:TonB-dependent receptor [Dyella sp.]|jgi:outer membrane receptor protein involved in Fe transport|uniref:TonB-dependent receptor n=1 Tax=Dyella sp. TaxID=1869338 RepID=UPI002D791EC9|nr:TonB-dependent receptor [Dyella sp.]HET6431788.1 TonB-dependent receptor [Dyella sp.]
MKSTLRTRLLPVAIAALLAAGTVSAQNVTTSGVAGRVLDAAGQPVANATVTIVHQPSGTTKTVTTDADGRYAAQGLRVGGPFEITANKDGVAAAEQDNVFLQLGQPSSINLSMGANAAQASNLTAVTVSASTLAQTFSPDNKGLSTNISQDQLKATPQGNRSVDDVARLDPRITVLDQGVGSISANGMNNRYNNIAVDGVTQGDPFGLNANGLPYQKAAISPETIAEYNISTATYDVTSDTVGADVNAVTKSGTNAFHGSAYYSYRNANHLVGDAGWLPSDNRGYKYNGYDKDSTYGVTVGGPIIKDKLFFFVAAEHEKTTGIGADSANGLDQSLGNGPSTSGKVSPGDLQQVIDTATALGLTPGNFGGATGLTYDDKRYLGKIDWNITDNHRASFTYQNTKELLPAVGGNGPSSVGLSSYTYTKEITTKNYVGHLFDDWTENFSTEAKVGYQEYVQDTTAPFQQPAVNVNLSADGKGPSVNLGEERFRHYNHIDTKKLSVFLAATYYLGDHVLKGGIDYQRNKINNLFGQAEFGVYTFWGLDNFAAGNYNKYELYHPAPGYQLDDIAGKWTYSQYSPFLQDTWQVNDQLSLQYGVRVDIPHSGGKPEYNAGFEQAFGYRNDYTVGSSNRVVEPRLSFNYSFDSDYKTQLRGGAGLFQTSPPTVWMTNPFQNNGVTLLSYTSFDPSTAPFNPDPLNQPIPAGGGAGSIDTIDKNFKLPTVWKMSLALDRELPWWGLVASAEYQHIQVRDGILYQAVNFGAPTGTLPDGRDQFWATPGEAPTSADAQANRNKAFSSQSTLLTNTHKGKSDSFTLAISKPFTAGFSGGASVTLNHATDVDPGTDTIAYNGYARVARLNPNSDVSATSNYNVAKSVKLSLNWRHNFFGDYASQVSMFYSGRTGNPYTWVFGNDANGDSISGWDPAYIPGANDAKVSYGNATAQQIQQFQDFLASDKYLKDHRGQVASRNGAHAPWVTTLDMSFSQEIPGLFKGNKGELRLDVYNFLNLLNRDWGQQRYAGIYPTRTLVNYGGVNAQGQYVYNLPTDQNGNYQPQKLQVYDGGFYDPSRVVSRWSAMLTVRYTF